MQRASLQNIDDTRIREIKELLPPAHVLREFPASERTAQTTFEARHAIHRILHGADDRLLVIVGPCSIHDVRAAREYAERLKREKERLEADLLIVMRVYFEKPRTTVGWKGLINDPFLDGSFRINEGLRTARQLLLELNVSEEEIAKRRAAWTAPAPRYTRGVQAKFAFNASSASKGAVLDHFQ